MKSNSEATVQPVPFTATFINGRKYVTFTIQNTRLEDWVDKQEIQTLLHISNRTLQTLRSRKQIPWSVIGGKILYYRPGIVALIEQNLFYNAAAKKL